MPTIADIASSDANFSILLDIVEHIDTDLGAGLAAQLSDSSETLTLFAPANSAFSELAVGLGFGGDSSDPDAVSEFLTTNVAAGTLLDIVTYHILPDVRFSADLPDGASFLTVQGAEFTRDGTTLIDLEPDLADPSLVLVDQAADNGVVHVVDRVLLPVDLPGNDAPSIAGLLLQSGGTFDSDGSDFDILLNAAATAGLTGALGDLAADVTIFAPTDSAFIALAQALGYSGSDEAGTLAYLTEAMTLIGKGDPAPVLQDILTYHVLPESLQLSQLQAVSSVTTLQTGTITISGTTLVDGDPDIVDPSFVQTDIVAGNGIAHVIDGVLLPRDYLVSDGSDDVDFVITGDGKDTIETGDDADFIDTNAGNDRIWSGSGDDVVLGGANRDYINAGDGNDFVDAGSGNDSVFGGRGNDELFGGDSRDFIVGQGGRDFIDGGNGNDTIHGGNGRDTIDGDTGNDWITGGLDNDVISGGGGADRLIGSRGDDTIDGGIGNDILVGERGRDVFVFGLDSGEDRVSDFRSGQDKIDLSALGFGDVAEVMDGITRSSQGLEIDLGDGNEILLAGLSVKIDAGDFIL